MEPVGHYGLWALAIARRHFVPWSVHRKRVELRGPSRVLESFCYGSKPHLLRLVASRPIRSNDGGLLGCGLESSFQSATGRLAKCRRNLESRTRVATGLRSTGE